MATRSGSGRPRTTQEAYTPSHGAPSRLLRYTGGAVFALAALVFVVALAFSYLTMPVSSTADAKSVLVTVPQGMGAGAIADLLEREGVVRSGRHFHLFSRLSGADKNLQAGDYLLSTDLSLPDIVQRMQHGRVEPQTVMIPEGLHLRQIADLLAREGLVDRERFLEVAQDETLVYPAGGPIPKPVSSLEGYLFPDTYQFVPSMTEEQIVRVMVDRFVQAAMPLLRKGRAPQGMSVHDVVTLASIVEKEALLRREMPVIASVFLNRLAIDMPLQADPTVAYLFDEHRSRLLFADLEIPSPYNTYRNKGLPPGPIASPGLHALQAVLQPEQTEYLFFVARGDGTHVFTRTFNEHVREANRIRR